MVCGTPSPGHPGFYSPPPNGLPQLHQQSLIRSPHGLPMPSSLQKPLQYPNFNSPTPAGSSTFQGSSLPEPPASLFPFRSSSQTLAPSSLPFTSQTQSHRSLKRRNEYRSWLWSKGGFYEVNRLLVLLGRRRKISAAQRKAVSFRVVKMTRR
ncbi:hypothetical protein BRARA_D00935 [Brassica rapa]|uniref:Uncharacterized protein n=1 Tax=Brassica campestris TaxID=3711 RepID=A0A397ZJF2_BRACM|nr:hypothetical protein BRARA_D00935 [Brassica rapa]